MPLTRDEYIDLAKPDGGSFYAGSLEEAEAFCKNLALKHYENFPVGSALSPKKLRKHFFSIYSFARIADDIADEDTGFSQEERLKLLDDYESILLSIDTAKPTQAVGNPIFIALAATMREKSIPAEPLQKLLIAFRRDILFKQPKNFEDLEDYCKYSANPVGELVLRIFDLYDEKTAPLSDKICTGLQLANFWQDISIDLKKERLYIPSDILDKYGLNKDCLHDEKNSIKLRQLLNEIYNYTDNCFIEGSHLISYLPNIRLRAEIAATLEGGQLILNKSRLLNIKILSFRPKLNSFDILKTLFRAVVLCKFFF